MGSSYITLVETDSFYKESRKHLSESEIDELKVFLALNPKEGDLIPGLKGLRKIRWQTHRKGKSGGVRVIYFFYNENCPLFLLEMYSKAQKTGLSPQDKKLARRLVEELVKTYGG